MKQLTARQEQDIVNNFAHKIGARIKITSMTMRVPEPMSYEYSPRYDYMKTYLQTYEVPVVEAQIPLDKFRELAEHSHDIEDLKAHFGPNIHEIGMNVMRRDFENRNEAAIRRTNPGVQKAWERYQTMLKIAGG